MNAREVEKQAWEAFSKWKKQRLQDHPEDEDLDDYTLALMYPDGKLPNNRSFNQTNAG